MWFVYITLEDDDDDDDDDDDEKLIITVYGLCSLL